MEPQDRSPIRHGTDRRPHRAMGRRTQAGVQAVTVDWLKAGEPHGRTAARIEAQQLGARVICCAAIDMSHVASARRVLRATSNEWDRVDLLTMLDLAVYLVRNG